MCCMLSELRSHCVDLALPIALLRFDAHMFCRFGRTWKLPSLASSSRTRCRTTGSFACGPSHYRALGGGHLLGFIADFRNRWGVQCSGQWAGGSDPACSELGHRRKGERSQAVDEREGWATSVECSYQPAGRSWCPGASARVDQSGHGAASGAGPACRQTGPSQIGWPHSGSGAYPGVAGPALLSVVCGSAGKSGGNPGHLCPVGACPTTGVPSDDQGPAAAPARGSHLSRVPHSGGGLGVSPRGRLPYFAPIVRISLPDPWRSLLPCGLMGCLSPLAKVPVARGEQKKKGLRWQKCRWLPLLAMLLMQTC